MSALEATITEEDALVTTLNLTDEEFESDAVYSDSFGEQHQDSPLFDY